MGVYRPINVSTLRAPADVEGKRRREMSNYWRIRLTTAIDHLEREARKMLQLEEELGSFATRFHDAMKDAIVRFAALNQPICDSDMLTEWPDVVVQCQARAERRVELKERYRSLAKEIHPDRAMVVDGSGAQANSMHRLNVAYQHGDLAALIKLEAELLVAEICGGDAAATSDMEAALYEIKRAADTYADAYRSLLSSPLNGLMLRAMSARLAGWDWIDSIVKKLERSLDEKERTSFTALAALSDWEEPAQMM